MLGEEWYDYVLDRLKCEFENRVYGSRLEVDGGEIEEVCNRSSWRTYGNGIVENSGSGRKNRGCGTESGYFGDIQGISRLKDPKDSIGGGYCQLI